MKIKKPKPRRQRTVEWDFLDVEQYIMKKVNWKSPRDYAHTPLYEHACNCWSLRNDSYLEWWKLTPDELEADESEPDLAAFLKVFYEEFVWPFENKRTNILFRVCW